VTSQIATSAANHFGQFTVALTGFPEEGDGWRYTVRGTDLSEYEITVPLYTIVIDAAKVRRSRQWAAPYIDRYRAAYDSRAAILAVGSGNTGSALYTGGRIVRAIAWRRTGREKDGWRAAGAAGRIVGLVVLGIGLAVVVLARDVTNGAMIALSGWFLVLSARAIRERVKVDELIGDLHVGDVMEVDTPTVHPGLTVDTFAGQLLDRDVPTTAIAVVRGDEVVGILGVRQVQRLRPAELAAKRVEDVMARPPRLPVVQPSDGLVSAVQQLQRAGLDGLPVVEHGRLVGVLTRRSIGLAVQARTGGPGGTGDAGSDAAEDAGGGADSGPDNGTDGPDAEAGPDSGAGPSGPTPGAPA